NLGSTFAIFVDGLYRIAKLKDFKGDVNYAYQNSFDKDSSSEQDVTMWYYEFTTGTGKTFSDFEFAKEKPDYPDVTNVRTAEIDLSGLAARVGFRIKFGGK
ncbi:MAG: hypothetical protein MUP98_05840, partial [Candidatus Aminicenantes bacterium]|nr:hypothetical protein [Candidatus Aminicenantes bacterium]